jgi:Hexapeptide repeat of succinyl-transferase
MSTTAGMKSEVDMFSGIKWRVLYALKGSTYAARALGVTIGEGCRIYTSFGNEPWLISIGDRVTVTSGVKFITHDGATGLVRDEKGRRYRYAPIEIGSDVFIGTNSIILPGVRIGNRVIVAAGSVVNRSIPDNCVVAGVPARFIKTFDEYELRVLAQFHSNADRTGKSRRQQIDRIVDETMAPEIPIPASTNSKNESKVQAEEMRSAACLLVAELRLLGYKVELAPLDPGTAPGLAM